jgi:hypothetical protein
MNPIFGDMSIDVQGGLADFGTLAKGASIFQIIEAFARQSDGMITRAAFGRTGVLMLSAIPRKPETGAFYLYDKPTRTFYNITFNNADNFSPMQFDQVIKAYKLNKLLDYNNAPVPTAQNVSAIAVRQVSDAVAQVARPNKKKRRNFRSGRTTQVRTLYLESKNQPVAVAA